MGSNEREYRRKWDKHFTENTGTLIVRIFKEHLNAPILTSILEQKGFDLNKSFRRRINHETGMVTFTQEKGDAE
jgi:hypothetical protein